jgi:endoglucanase
VLNANYTYPTTAELDYYKSKGLTLIRLPFTWERVQHIVGGPLDSDVDLLQIKQFVKSAQDRGIYVMLDMHNYARRDIDGTSYLIGQTENLTIAHFVDVWTKLAYEFKDYTNIWGYDLMNEPNNMGSVSLFKITQAVVTGIRTVDLNTPIVIEGNDYASSYSWPSNKSDSLKYLVDPSNKLIYEAHCYFDNNASGIYAGTYDVEIKTANIALIRLKPFVDWLKTNNKIGMIGEFGVPGNDPRWLTMLDGALNYMKQNNVSGTYWAAGPWWGTYPLSIEPDGNVDKPQMAILSKYGNDKLSAVEELKSVAEISIYPNPTTDNIFIKSDSKIKSVDIYNNLGILLFQQKTSNQEFQKVIPLSQFVSGNYVLKVMLEDNSFVIKKVVKI